jgi:hypothetical protein
VLAGTSRSFRQVALFGGLAVACTLISAAPVRAAWESPRVIDNGGGGFGATSGTQTGLAAGPNGLTSVLFLQPPPSATQPSPFMVRRPSGATTGWSAPAAVGMPAGGPSVIPNPALAAAGGGALGAGGTLGLVGFQPPSGSTEVVSLAWPSAAAGPSPAAPALCTAASTPECATSPQLEFDGSGVGYAVGTGSGTDILFARTDSADTWQPAQVIAQGTSPQLAVDPAGDVVVIYARQDNSTPGVSDAHEYAIRQPAGQGSFSGEQQVSGPNSVSQTAASTAVVIDDSGTATAVFEEDTVPPNFFSSVAPVVQAVRWPLAQDKPAAEQQVSGSDTDEGTPGSLGLAVDPVRDVTVTWAGSSTTTTIYAAQLAGGTWGPPEQVSPSDGRSAGTPLVAADPAGTVTIVYTDSMPPTFDDVDVKATRPAPGGGWSPPVSLRSTDPSAGAVGTLTARLVATHTGQADVIFVQQLNGTNRLFATRLDDSTPPSIQIVTPRDGASYRQGTTVLADYSCADEAGGSGLAACAGAVPEGHRIETSSPGAKAFTVSSSDRAGNSVSRTVHYTVQAGAAPKDTTPPRIALRAPRDRAGYTQGQRVLARFSCSDPDSQVKSCRGTVASGHAIGTRGLGRHSFSVIARDPAGNTASKTVHYTVIRSVVLPRIRLTVTPQRVSTGRRARLRFRATTCASGRCHGLSAVQIVFHRRTKRTSSRGYATFKVSLRKPGRYAARAREPGYRRGKAIVTARRAH